MKRKTAIIILMVIVVIAALVVAYLTFFAGKNKNGQDIDIPTQPDQNFFPIGGDSDNNDNFEPNNNDNNFGGLNIPKLRQLYAEPAAGFGVFERIVGPEEIPANENPNLFDEDPNANAATSSQTVYFITDRANGNIYETTSTNLNLKRLTNTTIPQIRESIFFDDGMGVIMRYLDEANIVTYVANLTEPESTSSGENTSDQIDNSFYEISGVFLDENITSIAKSRNTDDVFYSLFNGSGYIIDAKNPAATIQVLDIPISRWSVDWSFDDINLSVPATYAEDGVVFELDPTSGVLRKILDDNAGLTGKENLNGTKALYSSIVNNTVRTSVYDLENKVVLILSIRTLAEKCIWSHNSANVLYCAVPLNVDQQELPDSWYQGVVSFDDTLVKIDLENNTLTELEGLDESGQNFDIIDLQLSQEEDYIIFQNKKDLTIWSLDIASF
jgi:hypothetical protein